MTDKSRDLELDLYKIYLSLPDVVKRLCLEYKAGITGSTILGRISDIDLIIPPSAWRSAAMYIREYTRGAIQATSLGGWRFKDILSERDIDMWPMSLDQILDEQCSAVYYPIRRKLITIEIE